MNDIASSSLRVLIVDDEERTRRSLRALLAWHPEVRVAGECGSAPEAVEFIERAHPDLLLMDVLLPGFSGFEVLRRATTVGPPEVIFVTAYGEQAIHAFDVQAADYLIKPFEKERFDRALERAEARVRQRRLEDLVLRMGLTQARPPSERLSVRERGRILIVHVSDIDWVEAEGYNVHLHVGHRDYFLRERMHTLEERLDPHRFLRIHRSSIVNVDRVTELHPSLHGEYIVHLEDGTQLKLSRNYRDRLELLLGVAR